MKHLELFSGIGGFRKAFELLEQDKMLTIENIGFSEIDANAKKTHMANYDVSGEIEIGDICEFTKDRKNIEALPDIDIITAGFPCQSFSMMGEQKGFNDDRGQMFFRIMDIVNVKKPKYLLLENVKNLYTHDKKRTFKCIQDELTASGYNIYYDIFNTADFGLPQNRRRVFIFATLNGLPDEVGFSNNVIKEHYLKHKKDMSVCKYNNVLDILEERVSDKYFLSDKMKKTILSDGTGGFKANSEINQMIARPLTASMHKMHRARQDNYYSQDYISTKGIVNPILTHRKCELSRLPIRRITPREAFMLQGFSEEFVKNACKVGVSDTALYKQAGNSVSVNVAYSVLHYLCFNRIIKSTTQL